MSYDIDYLRLLAKQFPTADAVATEIVNLSAIISLPKGTEHFVADIHGEYEAFDHVMRNASGVVKRKIDETFGDTLPEALKKELATLVYYPAEKIALQKSNLARLSEDTQRDCAARKADAAELSGWYKPIMMRLIRLCRQSAYKYTRSKVRKAIPQNFRYIIEELLYEDEHSPMKHGYYQRIIDSIVEIGRAEEFIITMSNLISRLVVDHLHVIGDIYDRGPGAHQVLEALYGYHSLDIQWGNHDVLWIGAACGSEVCMADALRISLRYANLETLQDGYGLNVAPLVRLALEYYNGDYAPTFQVKANQTYKNPSDLGLISRMQKAMAVIMFKLEGQLILRRPELNMQDRLLLHLVDFDVGTITLDGSVYRLIDKDFPTVDPAQPYALTEDEQIVVDRLKRSWQSSVKLQKHIRFLIDNGGMYQAYNGNLLYHGCIPLTEDGEFLEHALQGIKYKGKALLNRCDRIVRDAFYACDGPEKNMALDLMWYLWCGASSPIFGKSKMATFEGYFIEEKETHKEKDTPYFTWRNDEAVCRRILSEFGLDPDTGHIINGHVPVKVVKGEVPVKANGRLIDIDGGFAKAYQKTTGIAGYTLISNSEGMHLVSHFPFESKERAIREDLDIMPESVFIEKFQTRVLVGDTDIGLGLIKDIAALKSLLQAYKDGIIKEKTV